MGPKKVDLYKRFGAYPIGDTGNPGGGAWGWWYHTDSATQEKYKEDPDMWYEGYFDMCAANIERISRAAHNSDVKVTDEFPPEPSNEPMIPIIEALACDVEGVHIVNLLNDGNYVNGIPLDFQVEIPALVSRRGVQPIKTHDLPMPVIAHALSDRVATVNMEIEAFVTGKIEHLEALILMDPWTQSLDQARALIKEIFDMPYHEELKAHFM